MLEAEKLRLAKVETELTDFRRAHKQLTAELELQRQENLEQSHKFNALLLKHQETLVSQVRKMQIASKIR